MVDLRLEQLSREQILEFRAALLQNARSLHSDAALLLDAGRHPRSHSLALLGFEELAKMQPLWSMTADASLLNNDWEYLQRFMKTHNDKLALALFTEHLLAAIFGHDRGDASVIRGVTPFTALTDEARRLNLLKQAGFYVEFGGSHFLSPSTVVTQAMASAIVSRLNAMLVTFGAFDSLCSLPAPPTREQLLAARHLVAEARSGRIGE